MRKLHCDFCGKEMVDNKEGTEGAFRVQGTDTNLKFKIGIQKQGLKIVRYEDCDACLNCIAQFVAHLIDASNKPQIIESVEIQEAGK